jgi:hypothetical protein
MFKDYKIIKNIINKQVCNIAVDYCELTKTKAKYLFNNNLIPMDSRIYGTFGDFQITKKNVFCYYGSEFFDCLLNFLKNDIEKELNLKLKSMYSYFRIYTKGSVLKPHIDRDSCEFSTTLNLGGDPWPIYFLIDKKEVEILLNPGDMLVYRGCELKHWRNKFKGNKCYQVFLHYNDVKSKYAIYDGRFSLGNNICRLE